MSDARTDPRLAAKTTRLADLRRLRDGHVERLARIEARAARWSWLRLLSFAGAGLIALLLLPVGGVAPAGLALIAGGLLFLWIMRRHLGLEAALLRRRARIDLIEEQLARGRHDWQRLPPARALLPEPDHPTELDLDLVGGQGLHRLVDTCASAGGSERLRSWLGRPVVDPRVLGARQAAVRELVDLDHLRGRLALAGRLALGSEQAYRGERMVALLASDPGKSRIGLWTALLAALALSDASLLVWHLSSGGPAWWQASFLVYVLLSLGLQPRVSPAFGIANALGDGLEQLQSVLGLIERQAFDGRPELSARCRPIRDAEQRPSQTLRGLRRLIAGAALRGNLFVWLPLNALLPWDVLVAWRLEGMRRRLAGELPRWLDTWYELEALAALANLAWLNPHFCFPELRPGAADEPLLEAVDLGHPLLPDAEKVCNDLALRSGEIHLITGSNMSGKSTWLCCVGINLALAQAGGPVDASRLACAPLRLFGCTRVSDSVTDGISYFYAEVRRLRRLLDALEAPDPRPLAWFIDEIFRGTNNRERLIGSRAMIRALAEGRGFGMVSTHDLELAGLAGAVPGLSNHHFREQIEGRRMRFDHRLQSGPSPTTNALRLMASAGLPVDPTAEA